MRQSEIPVPLFVLNRCLQTPFQQRSSTPIRRKPWDDTLNFVYSPINAQHTVDWTGGCNEIHIGPMQYTVSWNTKIGKCTPKYLLNILCKYQHHASMQNIYFILFAMKTFSNGVWYRISGKFDVSFILFVYIMYVGVSKKAWLNPESFYDLFHHISGQRKCN